MRVSEAVVKLNSVDIMTIIDDYVKVEGLKIESIEVGSLINVKGYYIKGKKINFAVKLGISAVINNKIKIRIFDIKVLNMKIIHSLTDFALSKILKKFDYLGFSTEGKYINLDLDVLSKVIPFVYFRLHNLKCEQGFIVCYVEDIIYTDEKKAEKVKDLPRSTVKDGYSEVRKNLIKKTPEKYQGGIKYAMILPDIAALLYRLLKDKRVSIKEKILITIIGSYLVMPIDIIPDFIPIIGKADDIAFVFAGLDKIFKSIPQQVIYDNWDGEEDIIKITKEAICYISKFCNKDILGGIKYFCSKLRWKKKRENNEEG